MVERAYRVQQVCAYPLDPILQVEMEALDAVRIEGMMVADKKMCRKLATGAFPWSPIVQTHREILEIWGLILKKKEGKCVSTRLLSRGMEKPHLLQNTGSHGTMEQIISKRRTALKEYRSLQESSVALSETTPR
jgi:hypothetical protein